MKRQVYLSMRGRSYQVVFVATCKHKHSNGSSVYVGTTIEVHNNDDLSKVAPRRIIQNDFYSQTQLDARFKRLL